MVLPLPCHQRIFNIGPDDLLSCHRKTFDIGPDGLLSCHKKDFNIGPDGLSSCHRKAVILVQMVYHAPKLFKISQNPIETLKHMESSCL